MWSCGVLTYCLLCGYLPFDGEYYPDVIERIGKADFVFLQHDWKNVSSDAQDLISSLIRVIPKQRLNAEQALRHDWIASGAARANKSSFGMSYFRHLRCGPPRVKDFKNMALQIIDGTLDETRVQAMDRIFKSLDQGTVKVGLTEFEEAAARAGIHFPSNVVETIKELDQHGDGTVEPAKFVSLIVEDARRITDELLWNSFQSFEPDKDFEPDGDGYILRKDVQTVLSNPTIAALTTMEVDTIKQLFDEVDKKAGYITFGDFRDVMLQLL